MSGAASQMKGPTCPGLPTSGQPAYMSKQHCSSQQQPVYDTVAECACYYSSREGASKGEGGGEALMLGGREHCKQEHDAVTCRES